MAWATVADVARRLGIDDPTGDLFLEDVTDEANRLAYAKRAGSGYLDDPDRVPDDHACVAGVAMWAARLYRERGMFGATAGFSDAELPSAITTWTEIWKCLGVPKPWAV